MGRICEDFERTTCDTVDPWGVDWQSTWEGSTKTLEGLPVTVLILGGSIDSLGRICEDFRRIVPPRINTVTGNPSKVFADPSHVDLGNPSKVFVDPSHVDCQSNPPPGSTLSQVIFPKSLQILPMLTVDWHQHSQVILPVFGDPSHVDWQLTPPPRSRLKGNPSKVFMDSSHVDCQLTPSPPHCHR